MADFLDRLRVEHTQLTERLIKLDVFIESIPFEQLPAEDRTDLRLQRFYMQNYAFILKKRITRLST